MNDLDNVVFHDPDEDNGLMCGDRFNPDDQELSTESIEAFLTSELTSLKDFDVEFEKSKAGIIKLKKIKTEQIIVKLLDETTEIIEYEYELTAKKNSYKFFGNKKKEG